MNERDITPPLHVTSTYETSWEDTQAIAAGNETIAFYARYGSPTVQDVERKIRDLCAPDTPDEYDAILTSSGMAAVSLVLLGLLQSGDEIIATNTIYGGTAKLLREVLPRLGIVTHFVSCDLSDAKAHISPQTKLMWTESPANPTNRLVILDDAVKLAQKYKLISCIDATLGPPPLQHPLAHGFDLEIHAATKYLGGHSDLLAGVVAGRRELIATLRASHRLLGATPDPHAAFLLRRGLLTLPLRIAKINNTAQQLAHWLSEQPGVARVHYLGLENHPDHGAAILQMEGGFGGIVAFDLNEATESAAQHVVEKLLLIRYAPSLGGTETLVSYPPLSSHAGQSDEQLQAAGISRGTLRLAVGLEPFEDLKKDLESALR
ncbi:MAG TPA: PLP-dependent aspartate aminotransferase family protein [Abditibacteriaceae bacterium]|jgi:cystathionine beta-lyase/cystathionine gamma-synthase